MIVTVGSAATRVGYVNTGDMIFNASTTTGAYIDTIIANVIRAPLSSALPLAPEASTVWGGSPGMLYGIDPTGGLPGIGITRQTTVPS